MIAKILVPIDFSPCADAALDYALAIADACGAEVEVLHVWSPNEQRSRIFAETPEGHALEARLSAAELEHLARVCGRLEFGEDASSVILDILERERFDLVVMGREGTSHAPESGHVATSVARSTRCRVVTMPPPPVGDPEAA
jgi:nucleotide-binding universal stress UspA family protein